MNNKSDMTNEQREREAYAFLSAAAHDLRNPMTSVKGLVECILSGAVPENELEGTLRNILSEINRLDRLLGEVLDVSRLEGGIRKMAFESFDIAESARLCLLSLSLEGERKGLVAECDFFSDNISVLADKDAIYRVLYNILQNAVKFSYNGGLLKLSITESGEDEVTVSVKNEGKGIPEDKLPHVFDRFFRASEEDKRDKTGLGLGMYISKTIIDAHGQKIWVDSEEGKWCMFSFTLKRGMRPETEREQTKDAI